MRLELNGIKFSLQEALDNEFATIPSAHIQNVFATNNKLYAPTFLELRAQQQRVPLPYKPVARSRSKSKGKRVQQHNDELDREMRWVKERLDEEEAKRIAEAEEEKQLQEEGGIECGCCFCVYPFVSGLL